MFGLFLSIVLFLLLLIAAAAIWILRSRAAHVTLRRATENPVLEPIETHWWESQAVFNPAAYLSHDGRVHLLYRALGNDGISRFGYASSRDGVHFDERLSYPIYTPTRGFGKVNYNQRYAPCSYDTVSNASGGGWGGSEDPRLVEIDDRIYMTFTAFDGWGNIRMGLSSITSEDFKKKYWAWTQLQFLSPPGEVQKNWLLFPEKINGQFAIVHSISPNVKIEYVDSLEEFDGNKFIRGSTRSGGRAHYWDKVVRGAGAPPLKTKYGWLLLYHAFDPAHADIGYKVGAMLLDLKDPTVVLYRSSNPILESKEWYENDWKAGVTYASGAVIRDDQLLVYYGGGDKHIALARLDLDEFLKKLMNNQNAVAL